MNEIDVAVIGGGVVGLSCALKLAESGASVCVIERESRPGRGMSTHNSGVIHAGIYYPAGSLKARFCLDGRERLYEFCDRHGVAHQRCGKLLVAADESEIAELEALRARGVVKWRHVARDGRRRFRAAQRAACARRCSRVVARYRHRRSRSANQRVSRLCRDNDVAMLVGTAVVDAAASNGGIELATPHERFIAAHRRQRRRPLRR